MSASLGSVLPAVADDVAAASAELNRLDGAAGDGDLGVTMVAAAAALKAALREHEARGPAGLLEACGVAVARAAPSTAGTLLATALLDAARAAGAASGAARLAAALGAAQAGIERRGRASVGDRTMLDALAPAVEALRAAAAEGAGVPEALARAAGAARRGAERTAGMAPRAGRARWLGARAHGHEDAGAHLVALILASAARASTPR